MARASGGRSVLRVIWHVMKGAAVFAFGSVAYAYVTLPDIRPLATENPPRTAFMELRGREARAKDKEPKIVQRWVTYGRISEQLTRAVLVSEDAAFWQHEGVDFDELQKSLEVDWQRGRLVRGASTITQQLAKNLYLSPSKNPLRKFRELILARRLEAELKKQRILELYLNVIEWGDGIYGAEAAARAYFACPASALGAAQAALLAGAIPNPRLLNPGAPTSRLLARQSLILRRMGMVSPPPPEPSAEVSAPERAEPSHTETLPPVIDESLPAETAEPPAIEDRHM